MKTIRKLKGLILGAFALVIGAVTTLAVANLTGVKAATNVHITYGLFDYDEYHTTYEEVINNWIIDVGAYNVSGDPDKGWIGTAKTRNIVWANGDDDLCAGEYWGTFFNGSGTLSYADSVTAFYNYLDSHSLTTVTANNYIVIVPILNIPDGVNIASIQVPIDLDGITAVPAGSYAGNYINSIDDTIKTDGGSKIHVQSYADSFGTGINAATEAYPVVGGAPASGEYLTGSVLLGAVATKVAASPSNPMTIGYKNDPDLLTGTDEDLALLTFTQAALTPTVDGGSSNVANIPSVKVGTTTYPKDATQVLGYDAFTVAAQTAGTTSVSIEAKPDQGGSITAAKYVIKNSDGTITSADFGSTVNATLGSVKGSPVTVTPTSGTWNTGETIYVELEVLATDGTSTNKFIVKVPKAKSTFKNLSGLTVAETSGGAAAQLYSSNSATATTTFSPTTTTYHIRVVNAQSNVYIKPNWTDTTIKSVTVDGTTVASSGSEMTIPVSATTTSPQTVNIVVTAQDDSTQTYKVIINKLSNSVDLASSNPIVIKDSSGTSHNAALNGTVYEKELPYGTNSFTIKATTKETGQKLEFSSDGTTYAAINSGTFTSSSTYFAAGTGADSKTVYFKVTSEDASDSKIYQVDVSRSGGSKKSGLAAAGIQIKYDGGSATTLVPTSTVVNTHNGNTVNYVETGIKYATKFFSINVAGDDASNGQTIKYSVSGGATAASNVVLANTAWSSNISFHAQSSTYVAAETVRVTIRITAQDTSCYSEYIIDVTRDAADTDNNLDTTQFYLETVDSTGASTPLAYTGSFDSTNTLDLTGSPLAFSVKGIKVNAMFAALSTAKGTSNVVSTESYNLTRGAASSKYSFTGTADQTMIITIVVTSEDFNTKTYYVKLKRTAANDDKQVTLVATDATGGQLVDKDGNPITFTRQNDGTGYKFVPSGSLPFSVRELKFTISSQDGVATTKIKSGTTDITDATRTYEIDALSSPVVSAYDSTTPKVFSFKIWTEKETASGSGYDLKINVWRDAADSDNTLKSGVTDVMGVLDNASLSLDPSSTASRFVYELTKSTGGAKYRLTVQANSSKSKIYVKDSVPAVTTTNIYNASFLTQFGSLYNAATEFEGGKPLYVTVVPENGVYRTYTFDVKYTDEREKGHRITDIVMTNADGSPLTGALSFAGKEASATDELNSSFVVNLGTITVPYSTSSLKTLVTFDATTSSKATLNTTITNPGTNGIITFPVGSTTFTYQGKAENTTVGCQYQFTVERESAKTDNLLTQLTVNSTNLVDYTDPSMPFAPTDSTIYLTIGRTSNATVQFMISDLARYTISATGYGATFAASSGAMTGTSPIIYSDLTGLTPGQKYTITLTIKSEQAHIDGLSASRNYTIIIYTAETGYAVADIDLYKETAMTNVLYDKNGVSYDYTNPQTMELIYKNNTTAYADVQLGIGSANANVSGNAQKNLNPGVTTQFSIKVQSEYAYLASLDGIAITGQSQTININVKRLAASTDNKLKELKVIYTGDGNQVAFTTPSTGFSATTNTYSIANAPYNSATLKGTYQIVATANDANATVAITNVDLSNQIELTVTQDAVGNYIHERGTVTITVTAEDGSTNPYTVAISTGAAVASKDNSIKSIVVLADNDSSTNLITFSASTMAPNALVGQVRPNVNSVYITVDANDRASKLLINGDLKAWNSSINIPLTNKPGKTTINVVSQAEDGTVADKEYIIEITSATADTDKSLSELKLELYDDTGVLVQTENFTTSTPTVNVSHNITKAVLNAKVKSLYSTVAPSNPGNNREYTETINPLAIGNNDFTFIVTSEDTTTQTYKITVYRDDSVEIDALEITKDGDTTNLVDLDDLTSYDFTIPYSAEKLDIVFTTVGDPANFTITAKAGTTTVVLTQDTVNTHLFTADYSPKVGNNKLVITIKGKKDTKTYPFNITRENGSDENYILEYYQEDGVQFVGTNQNISIGGTSVTVLDSTKTIIYPLARSFANQIFNPTLVVSSTAKQMADTKQYQIVQTNKVLNVGQNTFQIKVTSETGKEREYNVTVYVADTDFEINDIQLLDTAGVALADVNNNTLDYAAGTKTYTLRYPYSLTGATLSIKTASQYATVLVNNSAIGSSVANPDTFTSTINITNKNPNSPYTFNIVVQSEYRKYNTAATIFVSDTYTVVIEKEEPNNITSLETLTVTAGGKTFNIYVGGNKNTTDADITFSGNDITLTNAGSTITSFNIEAIPTKLPTMTSLTGVVWNTATGKGTQSITMNNDVVSQSHSIVVYNEDKSAFTTYNLVVFRGAAINPDDDNTITNIEVYDNSNTYYINGSIFSQSVTSYSFNTATIPAIPYAVGRSYTIIVSVAAGSQARINIDGSFVDNKTKSIIINYPVDGTNYNATHTIYAESKNGSRGTNTYTINVVSLVAGANADLSDLRIDGVTVDGFNAATLKYTFPYTFDTSYDVMNIYAKAADSNAGILITNATTGVNLSYNYGDLNLVTGKNIINVIVTAENGITKKTYVVEINRDYEDPYLVDIEVIDQKLVNSSYTSKMTFDKDVQHYYVKLAYGINELRINTTLSADSSNYTVVCSNSSAISNVQGNTVRTFKIIPTEGVKDYSITVRSPQGKSVKYTLTVKLNSSDTASTNINQISTGSGLPGLSGINMSIVADPENPGQFMNVLDITDTGIDELPGVQELINEEGGTTYFKPLNSIAADYSNGDTVQKYGPYVVANRVRSVTDSILNIVPEKIKDSDGDGAHVKIINGNLGIGANTVIVQITSEDGNNVRTVLLDVIRMDNQFTIAIDEIADFEDDFDKSDVQDEYNVPANVTELNFQVKNKDKADTNQPTFTVVNGTNLKAGRNVVKVLVTPADGTAPFEQTIIVIRAEYVFEISSKEIATLKDDFDKDAVKDNYEVNSKVDQIGFTVTNKDSNVEADQPTYVVSNSGKLSVGENNVKLTITAPDGTVSEKTIKVTRAKMSFTVNKAAYEYACEAIAGKDNYYTINLVDKTADAIDDYKKYIEFDSEKNDLEIELVSGEITKNTNEILVRVKTKDNAESEVIHFQLTSSEINKAGSMFDIIFWIILIIVIIILIIILICVNRDKYGSISKKRKNA